MEPASPSACVSASLFLSLSLFLCEDFVWRQDTCLQRSNPLRQDPNNQELFHQRFQQFCYKETPGPREALSQLWMFCCKWLRPEIHTKEQMLDLLVLEQFLTILPKELQAWVWEQHPESGEEAVAVLEDLEKELDEPGQKVESACGGRRAEVAGSKTQGLCVSR
uniref:SCAN box domain-containing protein n=1 Tax=Canis lupus familiaris TaxID=9615 RepID=A0A8C0RQG6_CANLF